MAISKKEQREIEKYAKSLYDNVLSVKIEENPDNPSTLLLKIVRGVELPPIEYQRKEGK